MNRDADIAVNNPRGLRRVLVARFSALGDVAMTVPVLYSACRCYPDVEFTMLTRRSMTSLFLNTPANLTVRGVNLEEYKGLGGLNRLFKELRSETDFDAFIDLHDVLRTKILGLRCRLAGIPVSVINKGRKGKRALTRTNNKILLPLSSSRARYRQAFHKIGLPVDNRFEGFFESAAGGVGDAAQFSSVTAPKRQGETWVGIAPFAKHDGKIYPVEMMEQVVESLAHREGMKIFLFGGGEKECEVFNRWVARFPNVISLGDKRLGFPVELALMSHLNVMLSMDSANMHLASLVMTPVVSIWGATHPYCGFKGWRQKEDDIIQLPMTCRPCSVFGNKPCFRGDYLCLRGISPQSIITRIEKCLELKKLDTFEIRKEPSK
jgi:ADP-heptose:LPS heptosyltransferase